jgi:rhodanese-related sulfurtransferase
MDNQLKTIDTQTLRRKLDQRGVVLVDVREPEAFREEHIKGAINVPLLRFPEAFEAVLNRYDHIVVYCGTKLCTASPKAAEKLDAIGYTHVEDYADGLDGWKRAGLPVAHLVGV